MIEQAMYFGLGFCAAALVALALLPAYWARALRLTRRRLEAQMATSPEEITAARDQLRAAFAIERHRLELKLEDALQRRHGELSEIGRRTLEQQEAAERIADVGARLADADTLVATREAEIAGLVEAARQAAESRRILEETHAALRDEHASLAAEHEGIVGLATERKAELLSVETLIEGLRARGRDLETMLATSRNEVNARTQALRDLEQVDRRRADEIDDLRQQVDRLRGEAEELAARLGTETEARAARDAALAEERGRADALTAAAESAGQALGAERKRLKTLETRLGKQLESARASVADLGARLETALAEKGLAEGALESARADRSRLQVEVRALRAEFTGMAPNAETSLADSLHTPVGEPAPVGK